MDKATFAAGCFWGVEYKFSKLKGILSTKVGYIGGNTDSPTYEAVCSGETGHSEAVELEFDPNQLTYEELLDFFWSIHDPTTINRQGWDVGSQYRSAIFYHNEEQKVIAQKMRGALQDSGKFDKPIVTEITQATEFFEAEEYHQKYYEKTRHDG